MGLTRAEVARGVIPTMHHAALLHVVTAARATLRVGCAAAAVLKPCLRHVAVGTGGTPAHRTRVAGAVPTIAVPTIHHALLLRLITIVRAALVVHSAAADKKH